MTHFGSVKLPLAWALNATIGDPAKIALHPVVLPGKGAATLERRSTLHFHRGAGR
jgi:cobalamin biosynthesis protein CobD/CbiB